MMTTDNPALIGLLNAARVEYIVIGGVAAILHGSATLTYDLDIVYRRTPENIEKLSRALAPLKPALRNAPPGLPFVLDSQTIHMGLNFTLRTELGDIDLLGEIIGAGYQTYETLLPRSQLMELEGHRIDVIELSTLIEVKRAAGRTKDLLAIAELEALWEEINEPEQSQDQYPDSPHHRDLSKPDQTQLPNTDVDPHS